jgi:Group 4 capsule polysaccharide lipoprotein gfcB, YjbF
VRQLGCPAMLALLLVGCSSSYREGVDTVRLAFHGHQRVDATPAEVAAKPFFQLQATSPDGQAVLILGGVDDGLQGWYARDGQAIFLDHGVVARTIGLKQNLDDTHWPSGNPFVQGLHTLRSTVEVVRVVDWSPGYRYGVTLQVRLVPAGTEDVMILGTVRRLLRVDEHVFAPAAGFTAENHYWVDPSDGFVWKSHQVVAPGMPLDLVELRPYRNPAP